MGFASRILMYGIAVFSTVSFAAGNSTIPTKFRDRSMRIPISNETHFTFRDIYNRDYVDVKNQEWSACHKKKSSNFALSRDSIPMFIESPLQFKTLEEIESLHLTSGTVQVQPWSGDYWAYAAGILGARFRDQEFVFLYDWQKRFDLISSYPASKVLAVQGQMGVKLLSPSEKYDLVVGDDSGNFTASMWAQGKKYNDAYGSVESWMGICHGWAPAAIMEPRPEKTIEVSSFDEKWKVQLNPSDIKGLTSYSWATNNFQAMTLGSRCNKKNPARDENGRLKDPECFDINPATWHLVVTHLVGLSKRSFVMDATYDYEVWNQPVMGYSYTYFNPQTRKPQNNLQEALVTRESFTSDRFSKYRSAQASSFVGISMKVGYVAETMSNEMDTDSPLQDAVRWVQYDYDLELDSAGKIIGGEWYIEAHPDFVWIPKKGERPYSQLDRSLSVQWVGPRVPEEWAKAARMEAVSGSILNAISEGLLQRAAGTNN
ncbi:MAG: hypothetical protein ACXVCY_06550 [Pseudobdellovibrionaceae bacterium]